ncbi:MULTISPECIES: hypothetical protein [Rhodomicrobium]|uniref:hypothetical protein n=1 Tax=Rhodomicrobium TaxID=1068 RepID=UPI001482E20F|nr:MULTISPECIES: hypothetical protein [Rhodomicrobium]
MHDLQQLHAAIHLEAERPAGRQRLAPILKRLDVANANLDRTCPAMVLFFT